MAIIKWYWRVFIYSEELSLSLFRVLVCLPVEVSLGITVNCYGLVDFGNLRMLTRTRINLESCQILFVVFICYQKLNLN